MRAAAVVLALVATSILSGSLFSARATPAALTISQTLRTSGEAFGIAVDAENGRVYVPDSRADTLYVFDLATGETLAHIPTGGQPSHVVVVGSLVYVSNSSDASLTVIDASTQRVVQTLPVGGLGLTVNRQTQRLYAAAGSRIAVLDAASAALTATIAVPAGANVWGLAVDPSTNRVYATDIASPRVLVYDGATNDLVGEIAIDAPGRFGIAVGAAGRVFVASYTAADPQLFVIDGATARVTSRMPVAPWTSSLAAHPTSGLVYAASGADRSVSELDPETRAASKASLTEFAASVAINPLSGALVVATAGGAAPPPRSFIELVPGARP
jgi:YVTN family beta-propeller protein